MTRINKFISENFPLTRKQADLLISKRQVYVNDRLAVLGEQVNGTDKIKILNLNQNTNYRYFVFNKPKNIATLRSTPKEKDIFSLIKLPLKIFPVGRLDKMSSGLLILTNDGRLGDKLLNPKYNHEKEYLVTVDKALTLEQIKLLAKGPTIEGYKTKKSTVVKTADKEFHIVLTEGKKHQIRRMCAKVGLQVIDLQRLRINNLTLNKLGLKSGEIKELTGSLLTEFLQTIKF